MQKARMVGNYIQHLIEERHISTNELSHLLGCTETQIKSFLKGRALGWMDELDPFIFTVMIDRLLLTADGTIRIRLLNGLEVTEKLTTEVR